MRTLIITALAAISFTISAHADDKSVTPPVTWEVEGEFEDIQFAVENAIINAGLVIDGHNFVGDMLARTKEDVGGDKDLFTHAEVMTFCSAQVSREIMERDPMNLQFCPYGIFVAGQSDTPGKITVGHQDHQAIPELQELLGKIVKDALMLD